MKRSSLWLACATLIVACVTTSAVPPNLPRLAPAADRTRPRASYVSQGAKAMVVTAHPVASEAGRAMLAAGGNAVDAAVAASFAISVVRPQSTGLGGGGFLLAHTAIDHQLKVYDFRERAPAKATRDMYFDANGKPIVFKYNGKTLTDPSMNGHLSVGVPGLVKGLVEIQKTHGKLPLAQVMQPAIVAAEEGFPVYPGLAHAIEARRAELAIFPASAKIFLPNGKPLVAGDLLVQKDLGSTLRAIAANGADGFYKGKVAKSIVAEMKKGRGLITQKDLDNYRVKEREAVRGTYRGYEVVSMPPPSSGGTHIIEILNILGETDYGSLSFGSVASVHLLAEAMRRAFADRAAYLGDPDFVKIPLATLLSKDYAKRLFSSIDRTKATPSSEIKPSQAPPGESPSTTHISVVDADGNAVSTTQTVNYTFGSCVMAPGTGVILNDEMDDFSIKPGVANVFGLVGSAANAIAPGKTMLSSMSPTLVFDRAGTLKLVVGSPGGGRIISATLQTIINVIDHQMSLADAVHAARIHHQWLPDELVAEPQGLAPDVVEALTKMGHKVVVKDTIGDVQAIEVTADGLMGVSDIRAEGIPAGF